MNKAIVQHNNLKNQESSRNDDPFDLPWVMQGATTLNHTSNLHFYAQELVIHYAKLGSEEYTLDFSDLPEYAQNELVRLYMEFTGRETSECVHGNDFSIDNDYTCALLAMLKDDNKETRDSFAQITRKNIIAYYLDDLQKCLDDACHDCLESSMNDNGYYYGQDMYSGDMEWRKI